MVVFSKRNATQEPNLAKASSGTTLHWMSMAWNWTALSTTLTCVHHVSMLFNQSSLHLLQKEFCSYLFPLFFKSYAITKLHWKFHARVGVEQRGLALLYPGQDYLSYNMRWYKQWAGICRHRTSSTHLSQQHYTEQLYHGIPYIVSFYSKPVVAHTRKGAMNW